MFKIIFSILLSLSTILLIGGGIYFSIFLHFPQIHLKRIIKGLNSNYSHGLSPLKSLMVSLSARIGVGSLAGISLAIYLGGPGTIFWIWIICIISSINSYCESYLGAKYQEKDNNNYKGGPSFYIEKGLHSKRLAKVYSILIIVAYILGFIPIQANTITVAVSNYYRIDPLIIAVTVAMISLFSIIGGIKRIANISGKIIPIIGISYILISIIILIINIRLIPSLLIKIIVSALDIKKTIPSSFIATFIIGVQRGIFSTESGLGTSSIASSCTHTNDKVSLGLLQILGVYFTVFIICTSTALMILTSNYDTVLFTHINGVELIQYVLNYHLGKFGSHILIVSIIFLAYSTIIAGYYYGESSLKYLIKGTKNIYINILKIVTLFLLLAGSLMQASIIWKIVDILVEILAIINMYSLLKLRKEIIIDYKKYLKLEKLKVK